MADEKTIDELLAGFKSFTKQSTKGKGINYERVQQLMGLLDEAETAKKSLADKVDAVTNEIKKELRAWNKKQQTILEKAKVITVKDTKS